MWDTAENRDVARVPHDMQCQRCSHPLHTFLACSDTCRCEPPPTPGLYPAQLVTATAA